MEIYIFCIFACICGIFIDRLAMGLPPFRFGYKSTKASGKSIDTNDLILNITLKATQKMLSYYMEDNKELRVSYWNDVEKLVSEVSDLKEQVYSFKKQNESLSKTSKPIAGTPPSKNPEIPYEQPNQSPRRKYDPNFTEIKAGDEFLCIKDLYANTGSILVNKKGEVYVSKQDGTIPIREDAVNDNAINDFLIWSDKNSSKLSYETQIANARQYFKKINKFGQ